MKKEKKSTKEIKKKKVLKGIVVSNKMEKTVIVKVVSTTQHPIYKKILKTTKRYKAHADEKLEVGQTVSIEQSRPISRSKKWEVISKEGSKK